MVFGKITPESPLQIVTHTPDTGVIFSDGVFPRIPSGMEAAISVSERVGRLVV